MTTVFTPRPGRSEHQTSPGFRDAGEQTISFDQHVIDQEDRQARLQVLLKLEVGAEPIAGSMHVHGRRLDFCGWVGLATALEQAISSAADRTREG